jgi:cytochrome c1
MRLVLAAAFALAAATPVAVYAAGEGERYQSQKWTFDGVFGTYDRRQLQNGLKVFKEVCANCHGLRHVAFRNLVEIGMTPTEAKNFAASWPRKITEIGDDGQSKERAPELKDYFVSPEKAAALAAGNGKMPPDLSLIVKAREGGADYIYALLTGYSDPPKDWKDEEGQPKKLESGQYYNKYFAGHVIAMAPPLANVEIEYAKGAPKPTVEQMARDVTAFLAWTAEPTMEERKRTGIKVVLFLLIFTGVFFVIYKRTWRNVKH